MAVAYVDYSTPPDGLTITSIVWDFGDGTTSVDPTVPAPLWGTGIPNHLYPRAGSYVVTETATFSDGSTASKSTPVTAGLTPGVTVDGRSVLYHLDMNGFVEAVDWDFGDGNHAIGGGAAGAGADGRHGYAAAGTYSISGIVRYRGSDRADAFGPVTVTVAHKAG